MQLHTLQKIVDQILACPDDTKIILLAPLLQNQKD
jgi:excinuclease UvrABC ATPase subunit